MSLLNNTSSLLLILTACPALSSCRYEEPPISFQSNPDFFTRWNLVEETAVCNQGSTYVSAYENHEVTLRTVRNLTYQHYIDGELVQIGDMVPLSKEISFTPPVFPNNIRDYVEYLLTGPALYITTIEQLNPGSVETCEVRRVYHRRR